MFPDFPRNDIMNSILNELCKAGVRHEATEDVFAFSVQMFKNFEFLFQDDGSELRQLELIASLFDHIAVECVNDVTGLINDHGAADASDRGSVNR